MPTSFSTTITTLTTLATSVAPYAAITNIPTNTTGFSPKITITLSTTDTNTNSPVTEGYVVSAPSGAGISPILVSNLIYVVPLSNGSGLGNPFLQFFLPDPKTTSNQVFMTYATNYWGGYYSYQTGTPVAFYNALRTWINTNPTNGQQYSNTVPVVRSRAIKFSTYGSSTNQPANAVTFYVTFTGSFGPANVSQNTNNTNSNQTA